VEKLFSPFYFQKHLDLDPNVRSLMLDPILQNYEENPNLSLDWNAHSSYGVEHLLKNKVEWSNIQPFYDTIINDFLNEIFGKIHPIQIDETPWYNVYGGKQSGPPHEHIDADFSMVHYIKFNPEVHKATTFFNPMSVQTRYHSLAKPKLIEKLNTSDMNQSFYFHEVTPYVEENDVIIFPSSLMHRVDPSGVDETRVVISLNFRVL
jgi:uncharacterized protein (TIGR02466 family)